ncbi:hypothetical protein D1BOALGB6SA_4159 [Olavius sp. associated proteobacterium Delta 1]|nr:hypothetical protein D1BOALGB6SA_4159 [Olavius sp. associated proteobacterium Delta 1]
MKIEDCKLNICGCRFAPFILKSKEYLQYSIIMHLSGLIYVLI